jgi:hypothetical protein
VGDSYRREKDIPLVVNARAGTFPSGGRYRHSEARLYYFRGCAVALVAATKNPTLAFQVSLIQG